MRTSRFILTAVLTMFLATSLNASVIGEVLMSIAEGIKKEAFSDDFRKKQYSWTEQTKNLEPADLSESKYQIASLINGLNDHVMDLETKEILLGKLATAETNSAMTSILEGMINQIDRSYLTAEFASKKDEMFESLTDL